MASDLAMLVGFTGDDLVGAGAQGRRHRRAAGRLGAEDLTFGGASHQPDLDQLGEGLVHLGQQRAAGDRDDDLGRQPPAQLLGDLVAEGLGALRVERPDVDVDERRLLELVGLGQLEHSRFTSS